MREFTPLERLQAAAGLATTPKPGNGSQANHNQQHFSNPSGWLRVPDWLRDRGIPFREKPSPTADGRTVYLLDQCPFNSEHGGHGEVCVMQDESGQLAFKCHHNSCAERGWQDAKAAIGPPEAHHYDGWSSNGSDPRTNSSGSESHDWPEPKPLPNGMLSVQPFDDRMLPDSLRPWVADIAERMQCPPDFPAVAAMIVLAAIVGRKVGIRPKRQDDWLVVPNLWGVVIGRPGIMKTPAMEDALNVLKRLEVAAKAEYDQALRQHEIDTIVAKAKHEDQKRQLKGAVSAQTGNKARPSKKAANASKTPEEIAAEMQASEPAKPVRRRYLVNDSTVEKLGELLNENPNGLLVFRDELIGLLKSLDKEGQEGSRAFYLEAWTGTKRFTYDRIGRGTLDITAACVSVLGSIQPGPLGEYLRRAANGGLDDDGLIQRFQLAVWPDTPPTWRNVDRWPDAVAKNQANATYDRLDRMNPVELAAEPGEFDEFPFLRFDDAAQQLFDQWRASLERRQRTGMEHPAIESHLSKFPSLVSSLALLIHLADEPDGGPVTIAALQKALHWADYLESHARRIYGSVTQRSTTAAKALADHILDGTLADGFSLRVLYRPCWSHLSNRDDAKEAVDVLLDHDWLSEEKIPTDGRRQTVYRINPAILRQVRQQN